MTALLGRHGRRAEMVLAKDSMHNALRAFERARGEDTQTDTRSADAETTTGTNDAQKLLQ